MSASTEAISAISKAQKLAADQRRAGHAHRLNRIYVDQIRPSPANPRKLDLDALADDAAFQELLVSVSQHGVLQPILVRALAAPTDDGIRYELVAGERRWRAATANGHELIPAIIAQFADQEARIATFVENIQRQDVPPVDEAEGFRQALDELGISQKELAQLIGKPYHYVTNRMKLLNLPASCREALHQQLISPQHAVTLGGFPEDVRDEFLAAAAKGMSWHKLNEAKKQWEQVESFVAPEQRTTVATLVARGQSAAQISRKLMPTSLEAGPTEAVSLTGLQSVQLLQEHGLISLAKGAAMTALPVTALLKALKADIKQLQRAQAGESDG